MSEYEQKKSRKKDKNQRILKGSMRIKVNDPGFDSHQVIKNPDEIQKEVMQMDIEMFMKHPGASEFVRERIEGEFPEGFLITDEEKKSRYVLIRRIFDGEKHIVMRSPLTQDQFAEYRRQRKEEGARFEYHSTDEE